MESGVEPATVFQGDRTMKNGEEIRVSEYGQSLLLMPPELRIIQQGLKGLQQTGDLVAAERLGFEVQPETLDVVLKAITSCPSFTSFPRGWVGINREIDWACVCMARSSKMSLSTCCRLIPLSGCSVIM
ncbi:hypothetical protein [Spirosoma fluminis]